MLVPMYISQNPEAFLEEQKLYKTEKEKKTLELVLLQWLKIIIIL